MILSRGRNYVFIHIPKTGGTALALALEARAMADDDMLGDTPKALKRRRRLKGVEARGRLWKHATLADIEGLATRDELARMFTFTMVRNPFDRAVSLYFWLRVQSFDHPLVPLAAELSFTNFVCHPLVRAAFERNPAVSYMRQSDGREHASLYIRLEHFERDAQPLFDHLGFALQLPLANVSSRERDWRVYYDLPARQAISESCREDLARFEYSFNH